MGAYHRYDWRSGTFTVYCDESGCENWADDGVPQWQVNEALDIHDSWHEGQGDAISDDDPCEYEYDEPMETCRDCNGSGRRMIIRTCRTCAGEGVVPTEYA